MRCLALVLLCCLGLVACTTTPSPQPAPSNVVDAAPTAEAITETTVPVELRESFRTDTYPVSGRTAAEIRADLNRAGPLSVADARRFDALTTWGLKWTLQYKRAGSGCSLESATVLLDIVVLLPELAETPELPARTLAAWQTYRQALETHEMGHVENQRRGALALQNKFNEFDGFWDNCRDLSAALKAEGDAAIQNIFAADRAYDEDTSHGKLQGAVFP
jgi:predicted secreted Zn-dependent protease